LFILSNQSQIMQNDTAQIIVWFLLQGHRTFKVLASLRVFPMQTQNLALIRQGHGFTPIIADCPLGTQGLFKILLALLIFSNPSIKHCNMASNESLVLMCQYTQRGKKPNVEAQQRVPGSPGKQTLFQTLMKKEITSLLPAPTETEMSDGSNYRLDLK